MPPQTSNSIRLTTKNKLILRSLLQNIRCIGNKIAKLEIVLFRYHVDVVMLTEHWQSDISITEANLANYKLCAYFCRPAGHHGGVALYFRSFLNFKRRDDICQLSLSNVFECCAGELCTDVKRIFVVIYRPPSSDVEAFLDCFLRLLEVLQAEEVDVIIGGDFNIDFIASSRARGLLLDLLRLYNLTVVNDAPTRVASTSSTCLDNFFVNAATDSYLAETFDLGLSDHSGLFIDLKSVLTKEAQYRTVFRRKYCVNAMSRFVGCLSGEAWLATYESNTAESAFNAFSDTFNHYLDICFPVMRVRLSNGTSGLSWVTQDLITVKNKMLFLKDMSARYDVFKASYLQYLKYYEEVLTSSQVQFNDRFIEQSQNKSRAVWSLINGKRSNYGHGCVLPDADSCGDLENGMAAYFTTMAGDLLSVFDGGAVDFAGIARSVERISNSFYLSPVCEVDVRSAILGLRSASSPGEDLISAIIVKQCLDYILKPFTYCINLSFADGMFPSRLKTAIIKPLFKKGDHNDFRNYRPVSLLSTFSKIYERIMNDKLRAFLTRFQIISKDQHGFCSGKPTDTALYNYIANVYSCIDKRVSCLGLFIDLSKAFDCVDHSILTFKMERYGINGVALEWFKSYLSDRRQRVCINDNKSDWHKVRVGVPQGSILGPTLFLLYINDLPVCLRDASVTLYADDINVFVCADSDDRLLAEAAAIFDDLRRWMSRNRLLINSDKTKCLVFSGTGIKEVALGTSTLVKSESCRLLGVEIDQSLSWSSHIEALTSKLSRTCYALHQLKKSCSTNIVKTFYYANFYSVMKYGIIHWGMNSGADKIFLLQKRALRAVFGLKYGESCRTLFLTEGLLSFYAVYILETVSFVHAHVGEFDHRVQHSHATRHADRMLPALHRYSFYQKSLCYMGCKLYNILPREVRSVRSPQRFKSLVRSHLLKITCYSVEDFYDSF